MKRSLVALALSLSLALSLTACGTGTAGQSPAPSPSQEASAPPEPTPSAPAAGHTVVFTDSVGRDVELPSQITRIVPSGPMAQMVLFALAPDLFVGLSSKWSKEAEDFLDTEYYSLPVLGQLYGSNAGELNLETLAAADPQLIIDIGEPKGDMAEQLDGLTEQLGIPTVHITATTATMGKAYRMLGRLLGREAEAETLAAYCDDTYARVQTIMEEVGEHKANVVYCLGDDGLNVIARGSYHAEVLDLLTNNLAVVEDPSSKGSGNEVDMEQLLLWDPDILIFAPQSYYASVKDDPAWAGLTAVQTGMYCEVPFGPYNWMGFPPSVNRYLGMLWLANALYPEQAGYDLYEEASRYYELFYHCDLSREQFDTLTAHALPQA